MKTFVIYEEVQVTKYRTIHIEAENETDAVAKYYEGKVDYEVDVTEENYDWDNAEIINVQEAED